MFETIKLLAVISRAEFLLPNLGSLIMGIAWGATSPIDLTNLIIMVVLSFSVINLSSAIGAQFNTFFDYYLDSRDYRKKYLVQAMDSFGRSQLKALLIVEFLLTLILVSLR